MVNESYTLTTLRLFSRYSETMATWTVVVGIVHSCCTDPTQANAGLVIILVITMQKSGTGDND